MKFFHVIEVPIMHMYFLVVVDLKFVRTEYIISAEEPDKTPSPRQAGTSLKQSSGTLKRLKR